MKIIECPRDAMQGLHEFIPTEKKAEYIQGLLEVGFDTIDFGSFVSPKAIPQMRDTAEVLEKLDLTHSRSKLLGIIANSRGAEDALSHEQISYLGFPFSVSETFQQRNTNSSMLESLTRVEEIHSMCERKNKTLVVYLSMAFGNPYGDEWSSEVVLNWANKMASIGIKIISLADTTGVSNPENIKNLFSTVIPELPNVEIGAHLHTTPGTWREKIEMAFDAGCRRFDGAIKGFGGCPMASDKLTGNMATENIVAFFDEKGYDHNLNKAALKASIMHANNIFPH